MLFSHLILAAGAVLTSVNHPSRPDPGDFAHLLRQGRLSLSLTRRALPSAGVARRGSSYLSVSPMADSKPRMRWGKRPAKVQRSTRSCPEDHLTLYANATLAGLAPIVERVVVTVKNYDGPKELGMYDDRRALAVYKPTPRDLAIYKPTPRDLAVYKPTPRDLAVYDRPRSVALYSGPIYHDWLRLDANLYHIVSKTCAPRLVSPDASSAYQQDALGYLIDRLSQVFVIAEVAYTIGQQAKTHGHVFVVAATVIGTVLTFMECISLLYTIGEPRRMYALFPGLSCV
ncbi:hypothetical protein BN14_11970 [Rhizoctonia solani AG-1 IB]|uniref:Uncharacterized protein n=1 Tax=Thanatephorus cucumeris (strain AG1-IB / isolate 7/3/14) TaxID=1108050 RepID=M5CEY5_THACB|nr:hypothetical protein BN14_11970 [Rhizoctonia solani AG-1 IB]